MSEEKEVTGEVTITEIDDRRMFNVDVGDMPEEQAIEFLKAEMAKYEHLTQEELDALLAEPDEIHKVSEPGFVIITHVYSMGENGKKVVNETCEFESRIKNRHMEQASMILDYQKMVVTKSRDGSATFQDYEDYLKHAYGDKFKAFLKAIGREV